jgi:glycosyl transferase family (putative galactosyltransferase)
MSHLNADPADYLIVSSSPPAWKNLARITDQLKAEYARKHGYHFVADVSDIYETTTMQSIRGFVKLDLLSHYLATGKYKAVVWMDADLVITNKEHRLETIFGENSDEGADLCLGYDHNGFHSTVIFARNTPVVRDYLWAANNTGRSFFLSHPWHEMEALRYFAQTPPYDDLVCYHSAKELCPILKPEYVRFGLPLDIGAEYGWEPGDWTMHLSALSLGRRERLAEHFADPANHHTPPPPGPDAENP